MTSDALARLLEQADRDPALKRALAAARTAEDAVRVATDRGFALTVEDLRQQGAELSDADLASASGGQAMQIWPTTPWVAC